jgi:site-specific DNA-methyltransferase (adenine-specific)
MTDNDKPEFWTDTHASSERSEYITPQPFYDQLNKRYHFRLDPCCTKENCKCPNGFTPVENGLRQDWYPYHSVFMNPPYGRTITGKWVKKAYQESQKGCIVVCLLPARTDTAWFHDYVYPSGEIVFIRGRLKFGGMRNKKGELISDPAPFPSMIVVFSNEER